MGGGEIWCKHTMHEIEMFQYHTLMFGYWSEAETAKEKCFFWLENWGNLLRESLKRNNMTHWDMMFYRILLQMHPDFTTSLPWELFRLFIFSLKKINYIHIDIIILMCKPRSLTKTLTLEAILSSDHRAVVPSWAMCFTSLCFYFPSHCLYYLYYKNSDVLTVCIALSAMVVSFCWDCSVKSSDFLAQSKLLQE